MTCNHDWVVTDMVGDADLRCYYYVKCDNCGQTEHGRYDEWPIMNARFK